MKMYLIVVCVVILALVAFSMKKKEKPTIVTLGFVGDIMLGRLVDEIIKEKGPCYPLGNTIALLQSNDLNIGNLETTLTTSDKKVPKVFNFKAHPGAVDVLKLGNISVVSLANNHSKDFADEGLLETMQVLKSAGVGFVGVGKNSQQAKKPLIVTIKGMSIGIIGATDNEPSWKATEYDPGTFYVSFETQDGYEELLDVIKTLKATVDMCIVSLHWGPNMRDFPLQAHIEAAHAMIEAGADIIHGHSSHVFQGIEIYKNKLILYDTGDFIDDYAVNDVVRNDLSCLVRVLVQNKRVSGVEIIPLAITAMHVNKAEGDVAETIFELMHQRSKPFQTKFIVADGKMRVDL